MLIQKIISGGQTGVDRAALDVAIQLHIAHGGWCPQQRRAEDGIIPTIYQLQETSFSDYEQRTYWNIRDSDATLILLNQPPIGGTLLTIKIAQQLNKPYLIINLARSFNYNQNKVQTWFEKHFIHTLNIAGPRASQAINIYQLAYDFLYGLLAKC